MIKNIDSYKEAVILIRNMIISQSNIDSNHVLNSLSIRGQDLQKLIQDTNIYMSYDLNDKIILFKISKNDNTNNVQLSEENDIISLYTSYKCHLYIYGNNSFDFSEILKAKILTEKNIDDMFFKGINITSCSNIENISDFINNTIWPRSDFNIYFSYKYNVSLDNNYKDINSIDKLNIKEVE